MQEKVRTLLANAFPKGNWKYISTTDYKKKYEIAFKKKKIYYRESEPLRR